MALHALIPSLLALPAAALTLTPLEPPVSGVAAQPSVAYDPARREWILSWQAKKANGCVALQVRSLDRQGRFGPLRMVAEGCDWFVNWADFPSLAVADNGDWVSYWLEKSGTGTYAYQVITRRSLDRGQSWLAPVRLHDDASAVEHGFVSMAPAGRDRVRFLWLDGRAMAAPEGTDPAEHGHHAGTMQVRSRVLGRSLRGEEELLDADVCTCCNTDLARIDDGHMAVWRGRAQGEIRDIALATRQQRWSEPATVHDDRWHIAGCPVNGPALAVGDRSQLVVWTTGAGNEGLSVRARRLDRDDAPRVIEVGAGVLGRVDAIAWGHDGWLISWLGEAGDDRSALKLATYDAELRLLSIAVVTELPAGRSTGMPRLAGGGNTAVVVYTDPLDSAGPRVRAVRIDG